MSNAVVLRRGHVELDNRLQYVRNEWRRTPTTWVEERPKRRSRSPVVICVQNKTCCNSCGSARSRRRETVIESSYPDYPYEQELPYQERYAVHYDNASMMVTPHGQPCIAGPARTQALPMLQYHRTPGPAPVAYQPPVYQDSKGRYYTVDPYGRSRWL